MSAQVFQILVTTLLAIVLALSAWALKSIVDQRRDEDKRYQMLTESLAAQHLTIQTKITEITQQLWGRDGNNGHASEIRALRRSFRRIERYLTRLGFRVQRVEEKVGLPTGEHEKFVGDDDEEDDRRG